MVKFRIKKTSLFLSVLFFFSPMIAFPFVWIEIYNKKKYANVFLALFLSMCAFLFVPSGDLYRYWLMYQSYIGADYISIFEFSLDYLLSSLLYILANSGLNHAFARYILVFICALFYFNMIYELLRTINSRVKYTSIFFVSFVLFPYFTIISGIRFGVASVFYVLAVYYLIIRNNKLKGVVFLILSVLTHFSFLLLVLALLITIKVKLSRNQLLLLGSLLLFLSAQVTNYIGVFEELRIFRKIEVYTMGEDYIDSLSPLLQLVKAMGACLRYPLIFVMLLKMPPSKMRNVVYGIFLILCVCYPFTTIFNRFMSVAVLLSFLCYITSRYLNVKYFVYVLLFFSIVAYSSSMASQYRLIAMSNYQSMIYTPYPLLFGQTYESQWINEHFDKKGGVVKY